MKKLYGILALAVVGTACQHQESSTQAITAQPAASRPAVLSKPQPPKAIGAGSADTLTHQMQALLREYNLAALWCNQSDSLQHGNNPTLDGFFGPEHYRISFVFTKVWQDSVAPAVFHVQGKNQYKKVVTPFTGSLEVQQLKDLKTFLDLASEDSAAQAYTAQSHFIFREDPASKHAGIFEGTGVLDFYITPKGAIGQVEVMGGDDNPARGQGLLFKGKWTSNQTKQQKELLLARDIFSIAPDVIKDFAIGDRGGEVNPKYKKLGWDNYWENAEWWAETPKASLNL